MGGRAGSPSHRLRVERDDDAELLCDPIQQETRDGELVAARDANAWPHLVLPLAWHNFAIDARDGDAGIQAALATGRRGTSVPVWSRCVLG